MPRKRKREILTGVEIGTYTIKVVMGEMLDDDVISIVGLGEVPSLKVVKGEIVDTNVVQEQLERALALAEEGASGLEIGHIFLAVTGAHIRAVNSVGSTIVAAADRRVREDDVVRAARNAHAYNLPPDQRVLHYLDRYYRIDGNREVANPIGMSGAKLEADVHIIYGQHNRLETVCSMIADVMGYAATDVAFSGIASGLAVFAPEETERGALLVDIGAGVTEYTLFHGPGCFHSGQITVGCEHIVNDLAIGLRLSAQKSRKILHDLGQFGSAMMIPDGRSRLMAVEILGQTPRHIPISTVEQVIDLRLRELFEVIVARLREARALERIGSAVCLAGGGALIPGIERLAQHVFQMPVTLAKPRLLSGEEEVLNSPKYVTAMGLLRWGKFMLEIGAQPSMTVGEQIRLDTRRMWQAVRRAFHW